MGTKFLSPDRIGAFVAIILGGLSIFEAIRLYPYGNNLLTGDHTFPGIIGVLLILAGGMLLFERKKNEVVLPKGRKAFMMVASIGSLLIYSLLIKYIGYFFSTVLTFLFLIKIIGSYRWIFSIVIATILTTALYLLFIVLLKTPFPSLLL
ncbi:tripartite tricarboxylate transporter TctB family protein [Robertmurraya yapensis]|uniref:Tripartite tricarboxylate transporter TctB family protein n=2 Tax=Bacillaceae TaxID=186817 RepID=A0A431VWU7_9BACI|nr:tripartite tricarboxylate transporter TctB family protein [Bacillus yapensis]RTR27605.1 tripartite tricarboxylate transporter TctB family protein [Bacillus yapensis]TKS94172.1 tripartite tricarboxylate transporter TctB family protein [Bacillus yapensis]